MDQPQKKTSVWVYLGCGCGTLVLLTVLAVVGGGWYVGSKVKDLAADMKDPVARTARAKAILNAKELPGGYFAAVSLSVPLVMDMTMLSDRAPDAAGEVKGFDQRGFIYFKLISGGEDRQKMRDYFEGKSDDAGAFKNTTVKMKVKEVVHRGSVDLSGRKLLYVSQRGDTDTGQGRAKGLQTMVLFDCAGDQKMRMGIWFGEDPSPETPAAEADFTGTVADEGELRSFAGNFDPCGA
ncbi:MAG: hypothetical protein ACYC8T_11620 [Myxococcaceae bacterium]